MKRYHVSKNLFDVQNFTYSVGTGSQNMPLWSGTLPSGTYTVSVMQESTLTSSTRNTLVVSINGTVNYESQTTNYHNDAGIHLLTFTVEEGDTININYWMHTLSDNCTFKNVMLNSGSSALPYEPYGNTWQTKNPPRYGTSTDTITTLPADIYADGNNATVGISGNTIQNGTPTPDNPIMPQGCGERTGNLLDATMYGELAPSVVYLSMTVAIPIVTLTSPEGLYTRVVWTKSTGAPERAHVSNWIAPENSSTFELALYSDADCFKIEFRNVTYSALTDEDIARRFNIMLNSGSTALPYEPYGYKIPISSNSTATPVYLGEVQSTRRIKKLVLTGEEDFSNQYGTSLFSLEIRQEYAKYGVLSALCNAYVYNPVQSGLNANTTNGEFALQLQGGLSLLAFKNTSYTTAADFKTYLQQQYSNETPVTVWYILAIPTTGIVNEPIRKIGDYADTVSDITIPTITGKNTFDVLTTLKPSEVSLHYTGWHDANVHVYPDSSWMPTSWEEFRKAVRSGKAQSLYPVGTKLYENWGDTTSDAWIVVDYPTGEDYLDSDLAQQGYTNRVMLMEEKLNYLRVFDTKEAWLYVETAIPAGTYRFTIPNYDASYGGNKTYIFTSTADVPVGGQLTLTWNYQQNPLAVQGYSSSTSTSALFNVTIAEWDGTTPCTDLGTIKLAMSDVDSTYGKLNHIHRARYGSNNYYQSGLRQWLNADATANNWWTPSNIFDRPYDNRSTAGRLNTLNSNMKAVLATPTVNCITNNLFEYPSLDGTTFSLQTAYTVKDKLFLVTHTETNLSSSPNVNSVLDYYVNAGNEDRIKYRKDNGNAYYWWLRTPYPTVARYVRTVYASGALSGNNAGYTYGSAAACIIQ